MITRILNAVQNVSRYIDFGKHGMDKQTKYYTLT